VYIGEQSSPIKSNELAEWKIFLIVLGVVVAVALIVGSVVFVTRRKHRKATKFDELTTGSSSDVEMDHSKD